MRRLATALVLVARLAAAKDSATTPATLHYRPPDDALDEQPVATSIRVDPQGSDYAVRITFNKIPWGEQCKNHCANLTLFVDTDNNSNTGLRLGRDRRETGADLAINVQGVRDWQEKSADTFLRVTVHFLPDNTTSVENGDSLAEMDHRHDSDRVQSDGTQVFVLVDATNLFIPSGKTLRIVYHPPGGKPIEAFGAGMLIHGAGNPKAFTKHRKGATAKFHTIESP